MPTEHPREADDHGPRNLEHGSTSPVGVLVAGCFFMENLDGTIVTTADNRATPDPERLEEARRSGVHPGCSNCRGQRGSATMRMGW